MKTIAIVYFSGSGHTALMAEAVQRGAARDGNTDAVLLPIDGRKIIEGRFRDDELIEQLNSADAIILGTPTYMGGVAAQFKAFADATSGIWFRRGWVGKIAAGFTHSGSPSGDKLSTLQYLGLFAAQHGMLWIGNAEMSANGANRVGSYLGVMGYGNKANGDLPEIDAGDALTAEALGQRVAQLTRELSRIPEVVAA